MTSELHSGSVPPIQLSLVSHTNTGKTTLARTLLGRDIGEVRDAPHVTEFAEMHVLLKSPAGDVLQLWDTPGFGDSVRLARRLALQSTPLGWFLTQVWDRFRDRAFWSSQQALRHVREESDVVLYLVNAAESPAAAGYIRSELQLLEWVGKPVVVLMNQMGPPREPADEAAELARWQAHFASTPLVRQVLPMDAFARCWVQEGALLQAVGRALGADDRMDRLHAAWARQRLATFAQAMHELSTSLALIATARAPLPEAGGGLLDRFRSGPERSAAAAQRALADALEREVGESTTRLLAVHGLEKGVQAQILARVAGQVEVRAPVGEARASVMGGVVSGALSGLAADLMAGGLTLGAGMLAGGLLGAVGGAGVARAINVVRGTGEGYAGWSEAALGPIVQAALLRYLAIAHFGRGRGQWVEGEAPTHWPGLVQAALDREASALTSLWQSRSPTQANAGDADRLARGLEPVLARATREVIERLYPGAWPGADAA
ncbi:DUF3482 domain-containing protein [Rhizobacter sp. LjRoot28]|uniref:GTPase domain-containing protein n=1 Tax=Rhizobacter sp. LjRoot28 TaxID=3342309 RepID=UPI003ECC31C9